MNEGDCKDNGSGLKIADIFLWILLVGLLIIPGYLFYISFINTKNKTDNTTQKETDTNSTSTPAGSCTSKEKNTVYIYNEEPVQGKNFFEKFPVINNQQTYIAIPIQIDTSNPPSIAIYNHGDYEVVSNSVSGDFMEKLREYAEAFTSQNYIFAASAIHDNQNSSGNSVEDVSSLIGWIKGNYISCEAIYLIGFSRGGYTTTNYIVKYPDNVKGVALLAPATYYTEWNQTKVNTIMNIPINIWHGTKDINIAVMHSENFINKLKEYGKDVTLHQIEGAGHYDIDNEYISEILEFFNTNLQ